MKLRAADIAFSACVRERADWTCERCGVVVPKPAGTRSGLDCSHLVGRRHRAARWHPDAAVAHCVACHRFLEENPLEFAAWIQEKFGEERVAHLMSLRQEIRKVTRQDELAIARHYREQHRRMLDKRNTGWAGRIEFSDWHPL